MFYKILIIGLSCLLCLCAENLDLPLDAGKEWLLTYEQGTVRGRIDTDIDGKSFYSFQGIPYAKPPVGDLRFKDPEPLEKWDKQVIWDGTQEGSKCPQKLLDGTIEGDENCLFLNVYTRNLEKDFKGTKNVLVWFHGGSFVEGSGNTDIHGPKYIVSEDLVLVTFNYRLGALGFLTIDDPQFNISGNAGIKDQLLVLRWVKKYIHNFGGDATRVTIGGNSAGGISADIHMLSTYSENEKLFNRVISQSAPLMMFEITWPKPDWARELAVLMQFDPDNNSTAALYDHLKNQDVGRLLDAQTTLSGVQNIKNFIRPCLEPETSKNRIITDIPINIIKKNKFRHVPYLKGYVDQEAMFVLLYIDMNPSLVPKDAKDVEAYLPKDMGLQPGTDKSLEYATKVYNHYFHKNENQKQCYLNLVGDTSFIYPINKQAMEMAKVMQRNSLFYYLFTMDTELNLFKRQLNITDYKGAAHTDEKGYLFNFNGSPKIIPGSDLYKYIKRMLKLWTNFAKYGDPNGFNDTTRVDNVYWPSVTQTELNYLKIDKELTRGIAPFGDMIKFWDDLYESLKSKGFFPQSNPMFCFFTVSVFIVSVFYK